MPKTTQKSNQNVVKLPTFLWRLNSDTNILQEGVYNEVFEMWLVIILLQIYCECTSERILRIDQYNFVEVMAKTWWLYVAI